MDQLGGHVMSLRNEDGGGEGEKMRTEGKKDEEKETHLAPWHPNPFNTQPGG